MKILMLCLLTIITLNLKAQNYIGQHKDSIAVLIKKYNRNFNLDNSTVNKVYKYLKYVDRINEQTWLFFLDENDSCTYNKLMSDYLNYDETINRLNEKYEKTENDTWEYKDQGKVYSVKLIEGDWYFTIITKEKTE